MQITPSSSTPRTTKVRATKPAAPKSSAPVKKPVATKAVATKPVEAKPPAAKPVTTKPKTAAAPRKSKAVAAPKAEVSVVTDLGPMIATAAYYLAERRHFVPGYEMQDWLAAEQVIRGSAIGK